MIENRYVYLKPKFYDRGITLYLAYNQLAFQYKAVVVRTVKTGKIVLSVSIFL